MTAWFFYGPAPLRTLRRFLTSSSILPRHLSSFLIFKMLYSNSIIGSWTRNQSLSTVLPCTRANSTTITVNRFGFLTGTERHKNWIFRSIAASLWLAMTIRRKAKSTPFRKEATHSVSQCKIAFILYKTHKIIAGISAEVAARTCLASWRNATTQK